MSNETLLIVLLAFALTVILFLVTRNSTAYQAGLREGLKYYDSAMVQSIIKQVQGAVIASPSKAELVKHLLSFMEQLRGISGATIDKDVTTVTPPPAIVTTTTPTTEIDAPAT